MRLVPCVLLSRLSAGDKGVASALLSRLSVSTFQTLLCFHGRMVASRFRRERHYHGRRFSHTSVLRLWDDRNNVSLENGCDLATLFLGHARFPAKTSIFQVRARLDQGHKSALDSVFIGRITPVLERVIL